VGGFRGQQDYHDPHETQRSCLIIIIWWKGYGWYLWNASIGSKVYISHNFSQETKWGETCKRWLQKEENPWACAKNANQSNNQHDHYHPHENWKPKWSMCPSIVHNAFSCS